MNKAKRKLRGFTLLELITVVAMIAILSAILIPNVSDYIRTNHIRSANEQAQQIFMAAQDYLTSEQIRGTKVKDITGTDTPSRICWIMVNTEIGSDMNSYDNSNKTQIVDSYGIKKSTPTDNTGFDVREITIQNESGSEDTVFSYPIADGIESRLESGFKGSWVVAFYPKTFTVAYAVYNDYYDTTARREAAVKFIGTNNGVKSESCVGRLYKYEYYMNISSASTWEIQEEDFKNPGSVTPHLYTGQFPVPGPVL